MKQDSRPTPAVKFWESPVNSPGKTRVPWGALLLITLGAVSLRLPLFARPMVHDESYTYVALASRPLLGLLSDYHLPNNHIFHTLLVHLSVISLGVHPWTVRFPAFIAAALCVPLVGMLGTRLYSPTIGTLAAGFLAILPVEGLYAANARSYSLYTLFSLLMFLLAVEVLHCRSLWGWVGLAGVGVLGFWTVPFMLYPFCGVFLWLALSALLGEARPAYGDVQRFWGCFLGAGLPTVLGSAIVYLPVLLWGTGLHSLVGNSFVEHLTWGDFWQTALVRLQDTAQEWTMRMPPLPGWVMTFCAGLGLIWHSRKSWERVSPLAARQLIDAGQPRAALRHFAHAWRLQPRQVLRRWYKVVQALGGAVGLQALFLGYRALRRRAQHGRKRLMLTQNGFQWVSEAP